MPDETTAPHHRPRRLTAGLVALGSSAILTIYAAGYARTQPAADQLARQGEVGAVALAARNAPTPTAMALVARSAATSIPGLPEIFQDGTYTGKGTSRHGGLEVTVVIIKGHITSADITLCQTRYPCSIIEGLRAQVIARQSADVDAVTGATDSVQAYRSAIISALAQAR